jgi:uncharacterized protein
MKKVEQFKCVKDCSSCCVDREYYPTERYGKIGVLLLPSELSCIKLQASNLDIDIKIIPRLATGDSPGTNIIAYQLMGKKGDGTVCPFLDTEGSEKSPHGGYRCKIYENRPLACRAYPVIKPRGKLAVLDKHCSFCTEKKSDRVKINGLQVELEALSMIRSKVKADQKETVWRYATATGRSSEMFPEGWIAEP